MAENQFQGHREESESERGANTVRAKKKRGIFLPLIVVFSSSSPSSGGNQPATPVSFLLAGQIPVVFRAASDVEPGSIQLVPALT
jgi:hypothetical protein